MARHQMKGRCAMKDRMRQLVRLMVAMAMLGSVAAPIASAQDATAVFDPAAFDVTLSSVGSGFERPVLVTNAGDGSDRLFVVEQAGIIWAYVKGGEGATTFLDISDRVGSEGNEQGLLGLAFAPDYAESGLLYVDYTDLDGNTVVSRFTVTDDANAADPASEEVILTQEQPYANHNGGGIAFGPDGYLYISLGDGGSQGDPNGNGQNLGVWLGKILRIDVDPAAIAEGDTYGIPADNPFVDTADAAPEVYFYGLRNPWRFSFDAATGDVYIGDVGQDVYEEIDVVAAEDAGGQNFGWNLMEGDQCYASDPCEDASFTAPVFAYAHDVGGCSVTGGFVYRGTAIPELIGTYVFADYCSGLLWGMGQDADGAWVVSDPIETGAAISSFGEDEDGELYVTDLNGSIYQVVAP